MADRNGSKPSGERAYTVCRKLSDGKLEVVNPAQTGRTQEHACDLVVEKLSPIDRKGTFGAFLANSWREFDYSSAQTVVTTKKPSTPAWVELVSADG